jgi:altronate dehydratase
MGEDGTFPILNNRSDRLPAVIGSSPLSEKTIVLSPDDNVAVARMDLPRGLELTATDVSIVLRDGIGMGHKVALRLIPEGTPVYKYSQVIGTAVYPIQPGEWVHTHNVDLRHDLNEAEFAVDHPQPPVLPADLPRTFFGYRRPDGRVGTRNHIAVVATSNCASHVAAGIAEEFKNHRAAGLDGIVALPHHEGCGHHEGPDTEQLERTIKGMILNPNVAAVIVVGLGCEVNGLSRFLGAGSNLHGAKPVTGFEIQGAGGTLKSIAEGCRRVHDLSAALGELKRTEQSVEHILLGLNCGGSDGFSGISANPALGYASDLLVAAGGTVVLAETPEIYGAEQVLTRRAADVDTGKRLIFVIRRFQEYFGRFGATMDSNPAPGNRRGGLTNIVEKSLGAVMKGGTTMLRGVVDYAERVTGKGLIVMDTPGYDPVSITGLGAGGCNIIAFTTGRGSAIGFPTVPVLKIASNSRIFRIMADNMDVNAGEIIDGSCTLREKGIEIYRHIVRVASGEQTRSEILGHKEFSPWRIGPVV